MPLQSDIQREAGKDEDYFKVKIMGETYNDKFYCDMCNKFYLGLKFSELCDDCLKVTEELDVAIGNAMNIGMSISKII